MYDTTYKNNETQTKLHAAFCRRTVFSNESVAASRNRTRRPFCLQIVEYSEEGKVIPGLYAAGRTSSGFPAAGYNSGMAVADCTFFGRIAGKTAASADPVG